MQIFLKWKMEAGAEVSWIDGWPVIGNDGKVEIEEPSAIETSTEKPVYFSFTDDIDSSPLLRVRSRGKELYKRGNGSLVIHSRDSLSLESQLSTIAIIMRIFILNGGLESFMLFLEGRSTISSAS